MPCARALLFAGQPVPPHRAGRLVSLQVVVVVVVVPVIAIHVSACACASACEHVQWSPLHQVIIRVDIASHITSDCSDANETLYHKTSDLHCVKICKNDTLQ